MDFRAGLMLPDRVRTSSELLQPSISHPSLSTHMVSHDRSSADRTGTTPDRDRTGSGLDGGLGSLVLSDGLRRRSRSDPDHVVLPQCGTDGLSCCASPGLRLEYRGRGPAVAPPPAAPQRIMEPHLILVLVPVPDSGEMCGRCCFIYRCYINPHL